MKKTLLSLTVITASLLAVGAASAELVISDTDGVKVSTNGRIHYQYGSYNGETITFDKTENKKSTVKLGSYNYLQARLGFKATYTAPSAIQYGASFRFDFNKTKGDNGYNGPATTAENTLVVNKAFVSITKDGFGKLELGNTDTAYSVFDLTGIYSNVKQEVDLYAFNNYQGKKVIAYYSPDFGAFNFGASYSLVTKTTKDNSTSAKKGFDLTGSYTVNPQVSLLASYNRTTDNIHNSINGKEQHLENLFYAGVKYVATQDVTVTYGLGYYKETNIKLHTKEPQKTKPYEKALANRVDIAYKIPQVKGLTAYGSLSIYKGKYNYLLSESLVSNNFTNLQVVGVRYAKSGATFFAEAIKNKNTVDLSTIKTHELSAGIRFTW